MAALSARCIRSIARVSVQISVRNSDLKQSNNTLADLILIFSQKTALNANSATQGD